MFCDRLGSRLRRWQRPFRYLDSKSCWVLASRDEILTSVLEPATRKRTHHHEQLSKLLIISRTIGPHLTPTHHGDPASLKSLPAFHETPKRVIVALDASGASVSISNSLIVIPNLIIALRQSSGSPWLGSQTLTNHSQDWSTSSQPS
jgi:hypothetical protein